MVSADDLLDVLKKRIDADDKKWDAAISRLDAMIRRSDERWETIVKSIGKEHTTTRDMIRTRYDMFGNLAIFLTILMVGIYTILIIQPLDIADTAKSAFAALLSLICGVLLGRHYYIKRKSTTPS